ncbi:MAG: toxin [Bacteroidia bacterium]|nr:toxin [Bacteroidia bacterium]
MPSKEEIQEFLDLFSEQKNAHGIMFYQRKKNLKALLQLEISAKQRNKVLNGLRVEDFYKGPKEDGVLTGTKFWEFGKKVRKKEVYIKISLGLEGKAVRCLSFHEAERPIKYPYKD